MKTDKTEPEKQDFNWYRVSSVRQKRSKSSFNPSSYEIKWQKRWEKERIYQPDMILRQAQGKPFGKAQGKPFGKAQGKPFDKTQGKPFYNLMMFPYPSAEGLHVGNMYAFTGADIYGRFKRMQGYDVFEPIGLDGFGIHSENYAIKMGRHPKEQAAISEKNFYRQLRAIGNSFAWENTLETYDSDYYKWTQWIFIKMFKNGLAYRKKSPLNFCPSCKTVLADEQVINGACERCKTLVEKREMEQWFFKITKYAEKLLQNTYKESFRWTEKVKIGQRNWIGKKEGINITYPLVDESGQLLYQGKSDKELFTITCFTTRPDTNFGATFVVLGPEHGLIEDLLAGKIDISDSFRPDLKAKRIREIREYVENAKSISEIDRIAQGRKKTGVFIGLYAVNQLNNYKMPVYISDFVLGQVGTGAVVGVPGHDKRDFEFAKEFNLPIIRVVVGKDGDTADITRPEQVQEEGGTMTNSDFLNGKDIHLAEEMMMDYLEQKGWGERLTTYKLRDWCISRQRYWGAPIPMIFCENCASSGIGWLSIKSPKLPRSLKEDDSMPGWFPVPEDQLPVLLPDLQDWKPEGTGKGPLAKLPDFVNVACPQCRSPSARRETDVCDTFLDSSWYFIRYPSVGDQKSKIKSQKGDKDTPDRDTSEVTRRDVLSSTSRRGSSDGGGNSKDLPWDPFITKRWLPVTQYIGGAEHTVLHLLYARFVWMAMRDFGYLEPASGWDEPFSRFYAHGLIIAEGAKMSKSRGNIIIPDEYIYKYGTDTLRTYLMFLGPFDQGGDFRDTGVAGMYKFLSRVWRLVLEILSLKSPKLLKEEDRMTKNTSVKESVRRLMHRTIKEVTEDLENFRYNTAIAHIMEFVNELQNFEFRISNFEFAKEAIETLLLLLAPFAPYMTEELWYRLSVVSSRNSATKKKSADNRKPKTDNYTSIHLHQWPFYKEQYLQEDLLTIVVQVNGKVRETLIVQSAKCKVQNEVERVARESEKVKKFIEGREIKKVIFVPGKLINFVV